MTDYRPSVPPWVAADVAAFATEVVGDHQPAYGEPLVDVITAPGLGWDWFEAAVIAGHVPHLEGIELALRATHASYLGEVTKAEAQGVLGDALGWTQEADTYRRLIALLEGFVAELEERSAAINRREDVAVADDAKYRQMWLDDANAARRRAERARTRRVAAEEDNLAAQKSRDRYRA